MIVITHTDLDGICCAALFIRKFGKEIKIIFATVNEAMKLSAENFDADYTCDLPKVADSLNIDHHSSNYNNLIESGRLSDKDRVDPLAPSATDLVFEFLDFSSHKDKIASEIRELGHLADTANLPEYYKPLDIVLNLNNDNKDFLRELSNILANKGKKILDSQWLDQRYQQSKNLFLEATEKIKTFFDSQTELPEILVIDTRRFIPNKLAKEVIKPAFDRGVSVIAVIYSKSQDEPIRVSFRVNKPVQDQYNVAMVAKYFGGGGHTMAAACTPKATEIPDELVKELKKMAKREDNIKYLSPA